LSEQLEIILRARDEGVTDTFKRVHQELRQHQTVMRDLKLYYREQHEGLTIALQGYSQFASMIRHVQSMYMQYNVAMIRAENIQQRITKLQEEYNEALQRYGSGSRQARDASERLADAQRDLQLAQMQNNMMMFGFILQAPMFINNLLQMRDSFKVLTAVIQAQNIALTLRNALMGPTGWAILGGAAIIGGATMGALLAQSQVPKAQYGGVVERAGIVHVERGEEISPAGRGGMTVHIGRIEMKPSGPSPEASARDLLNRVRIGLRSVTSEI